MSNTKHLADLVKVCSILPALVIMPAMAGTGITSTDDGGIFEYNDSSDMYTMISNGTVGGFSGYDASDRFEAAVIFVGKGQELTVSDRVTIQNNKAQVGGAIAITGNDAGATLNIGKGVKFLNNTALFDGGAIGNYGNTIVADGVLFQGNKAQLEPENNPNQIGGGAISLGSKSKTTLVNTDFMYNESGYNGGAIGTRLAETTEGGYNDNSRAILKIVDGDFEGNKATGYINSDDELVAGNGGAIYNTFYADVTVDDSQFESNHAAQNGGAIYNDGTANPYGGGGVMAINGSDFEYNTAAVSGGAIYNSGDMTLVDVDFKFNTANTMGGAIHNAGNMTLIDVDFENNSIDGMEGGALYVTGGGTTDITGGKFYRNHADAEVGGAILLHRGTLNIDGTHFVENTALYSGAIFTYSSLNTLNITNSVFDSNTALGAGAVQAMDTVNIKDTIFKNNIATTDSDGAGALFVGANGKAVLDKVVFENNSADYRGGAISTRSADLGDNTNAKLDVLNSKFIGNKAGTTGGAFDNYLYSSVADDTAVYFEEVEFTGNSAAMGGAIYNHGVEDLGGNTASTHINGATFTGNIATDAGGAIYNEEKGALMLSGSNTFTGNTANGVANDIHNLGTLTVASGTTSIDGGITGDGTLNISEGATLNINYASIEQSAIDLDGTLMASLLNANDTLDVTGTLSGDGRIALNIGATGVYDLSAFKGYVDQNSFGETYKVSVTDGIATVTAKNAQEIAADTGMSLGTAGAVSTLATSTDAKLQQVSLLAQEALNSGNTAVVEKEMAKLNPDTKPVGQSVASSVQNQVVTVAAGRMSTVGGGTGRAGGDVTSAGVWAQGLFNKSKLNGQFHGYTRGIALGGDTLIDDVFTLGGGFAFNNTDIHADGRHMDVDSTSVFVYGQYKPADWYVNATVNYTTSDYKDNTSVFGVGFDNDYDTSAFGIQAMYGYNFASGVTPEFGLRYLNVSQEEHKDALGRTITETNTDFLSGVAGVKYAFDIENDWDVQLRPELRAAMTYDLMSDDSIATIVVPGAASYYVDVDNLSRLGGEFGIGLTAEYRGLEVSLNYELDLHQDYTSQTGLLKFRYDF